MCDELLTNSTVRDMLPVTAALAASLITGLPGRLGLGQEALPKGNGSCGASPCSM